MLLFVKALLFMLILFLQNDNGSTYSVTGIKDITFKDITYNSLLMIALHKMP
jgi:hypothetical protein